MTKKRIKKTVCPVRLHKSTQEFVKMQEKWIKESCPMPESLKSMIKSLARG